MLIRKAKREDLPVINEIYNHSVLTKMSTADIDALSIEDREDWFDSHDEDHYPVFVSELKGQVVGWISISPYRPGRRALRYTAEVSYYVHHDYQNAGIGTMLLEYAITNAYKYNIKTLFAILLDNNIASIKLLKKFNFEQWGYLPGVADFDGVEVGQYYFGRKI